MRSRNQFRLLQKKRYDAHRFSNPYFQKTPRRNWRLIVTLTGISLGILCLIRVTLASPFFAIQRIHIEGTETIAPEEIEQKAWEQLRRSHLLIFEGTNRFLYDEQDLRDALSSGYAFETLEVARTCDLRGGGCEIRVIVKEKTSQLVWVSGDRLYLVDLHGTATRELTPPETEEWKSPIPPQESQVKRFPVFSDVNASPVSIGGSVLTETEVSNILSFERQLGQMSIPFSRISIDRLAGKWMAIKTLDGYDILIDAVGNVDEQILRLSVLLRDTVKDTKNLQYVDLRFGDHIYYK